MSTRTVALAFAILQASCSLAPNDAGPISQKIGEVTKNPAAKELDLRSLPTFGWNRFFFFKSGTTREEVCSFIGATRNYCGRVIRWERIPKDHMALLFSLNGQLTHVELHAVANGEFDMTLEPDGYLKEKSLFHIRRSSSEGKDRIWLEPR